MCHGPSRKAIPESNKTKGKKKFGESVFFFAFGAVSWEGFIGPICIKCTRKTVHSFVNEFTWPENSKK